MPVLSRFVLSVPGRATDDGRWKTVPSNGATFRLVEEVADRVLIIQGGRKVVHGSQAEILAQVPELSGAASLEDIFMRMTGSDASPAAPSTGSPPSGDAPR